MNNQFLTFQAPISIKILEFIGQTNRHKVRTQLNQSSTIISATPIAVYQFFHLTRYFLYLVLGSSYLRPSIAIPCATLLASLEFSFLITVSASPSTHISRKPISTAIVTACKHALASAIIGSEIFFHG
ncbi:NAD (P)H-quinone oxidoreductase subunit 5, chloroplastic [Gossypium arboreum]|uniref:Uncharacterized protein n=3 Tax=Gossypium arboreum TaxID=29729 RepID=A0ABR0NY97_GOSAR|nr:uncharacterized protein LOC108458482 isoform X2 [Gossypium arboreum]KAK5811333.1 hypothetical protein PVK06_026662 [Gossypium arboreum]KHG14516.1 NAD (P)H-quinone oxidoreductase subunit 5, chloroplastic [Gossypium arboreum]